MIHENGKTVMYYYPYIGEESNIKIFQDKTNTIKAFMLNKNALELAYNFDDALNYSVYFLFGPKIDGKTDVYVGQSINGVQRLKEHRANKDFWEYAIVFTTYNNTFDSNTIDYLEYYFINYIKNNTNDYNLQNYDLRVKEPNIGIFDKPIISSYIHHIKFLLRTEGINFVKNIQKDRPKLEIGMSDWDKYKDKLEHPHVVYKLKPVDSKYEATVYKHNSGYILSKGTEIEREIKEGHMSPLFVTNRNNTLDGLIKDKKAIEHKGKVIIVQDTLFNKLDAISSLLSGKVISGEKFFTNTSDTK